MEEPKWLNERELAAWKHFSLLHLQLSARLARSMANAGLSYQDYLVLATLSDEPDGKRRIAELGRELGWEKSRVSHHVARMCARRLVTKEQCPPDRRGALAVITPYGRREMVRLAPQHVAEVRRLFIDRLSADQLRSLDDMSVGLLDFYAELDTPDE